MSYQFKESCNQKQFFWFDRNLIKNMNWAMLSKSAKAVFPVIASHCDQKGRAFPGEETIAAIAGVTDKVAREGIKTLDGFPNFEWSNYLTRRGKRGKKFFLKLPSSSKQGKAFPFYKFIFDSGIWSELKPTAKALYPVMRHFSYLNLEDYLNYQSESQGLEEEPAEFFEEGDAFKQRDFEICEAEPVILAKFAGIHRNSLGSALINLEHNCLIEPDDESDAWRVFLRSKDNKFFKRKYLNEKLMHKNYR